MTLPHALNSPGMLDNRLWPGCSLAVLSAWNRFSSTLGNLADVYRTSLTLILIGKPLPSVRLTRLISPSPSPSSSTPTSVHKARPSQKNRMPLPQTHLLCPWTSQFQPMVKAPATFAGGLLAVNVWLVLPATPFLERLPLLAHASLWPSLPFLFPLILLTLKC